MYVVCIDLLEVYVESNQEFIKLKYALFHVFIDMMCSNFTPFRLQTNQQIQAMQDFSAKENLKVCPPALEKVLIEPITRRK